MQPVNTNLDILSKKFLDMRLINKRTNKVTCIYMKSTVFYSVLHL